MTKLRLFVATVNGYIYTAYTSETVSVVKTKLYLFFTPILSFLFSILFFYNFNSRTSYVNTFKFKRPRRPKKSSSFVIPSLF